MTARQDAAAIVEYPTANNAADATHQKGVIFSVAHSATSVTMAATIPKECRGRYWDVLAMGASVQWGFVLKGDTAPTLVYGQASAMGTGHLARMPTLLDGGPGSIWCPDNAEQVVYVSSSAPGGTTFFEASISSKKTGKLVP